MQITVLTIRAEEAIHELSKLTKRANRAANTNITFTVSEPRIEERSCEQWDGSMKLRPVSVTDIEVEGAAPKVEGYTFVARITHDPKIGNTIQQAPDSEVELNKDWRTAGANCEHCNRKRSRADTYIVVEEATGRQMQIGRTCLRDFTGIDSPEYVLRKFQYAKAVRDIAEEGGRYSWEMPVLDGLEATAIAIRLYGWCSKSQADEHTNATAHYVDSAINPYSKRDHEIKKEILEARKPEDRETAQAALDWIRNEMPANSDYQHNLKAICSEDTIYRGRYLGTLVSGMPAYFRHVERQLEYTKRLIADRLSKWQGNVKDRMRGLEVRYMDTRFLCHTDFGQLVLHKFKDAEGNIFTWKTGNVVGAPINSDLVLDGTVKEHDEWNEIKQTLLTRVKVVSIKRREPVGA